MTATTVLRNRADVTAAAPARSAEHVLGDHLERFGARDALIVTWSRSEQQRCP